MNIIEGIMGFAGSCMGFGLLIITMGVGSYFVLMGETTTGELIAMIQLTNYVMQAFAGIASIASKRGETAASAKRLGELFELDDIKECPGAISSRIKRIELQDVDFAYGDNVIFKQTNAVFESGKTIGIIGESGSGKSTILKILMGIYEVQGGQILITDIHNNIIKSSLIGQVAYVPCNHCSFLGTLRENVTMGKDISSSDILKMVECVNLKSIVDSGEGLDAQIEEGGKNLSAGQGQKIAIIRALLSNCSVVLFDEPTANLDHESRQSVQAIIKNCSKDRICIVVTHDAELINSFDITYTLSDYNLKRK